MDESATSLTQILMADPADSAACARALLDTTTSLSARYSISY
jgi:hypothetical protein